MNEIIYCMRAGTECAGLINDLYTTIVELATNTYLISEYYKSDCIQIVTKNVDEIHILLFAYSAGLVVGVGVFLVFVNWKLYRVGKALLKISSTMIVQKWRDRTMKGSTIDGSWAGCKVTR